MTREKWRYRCPNGHCSWTKRVNSDFNNTPKAEFYCSTCNANGKSPHFDELVDLKEPAQKHVVDPNVEAV